MSNQNRPSEWAAVVVLAQRLSIDGHGLLEHWEKATEDDHGEVPGWIDGSGRGVESGALHPGPQSRARCWLEKAERRAKVRQGGSGWISVNYDLVGS